MGHLERRSFRLAADLRTNLPSAALAGFQFSRFQFPRPIATPAALRRFVAAILVRARSMLRFLSRYSRTSLALCFACRMQCHLLPFFLSDLQVTQPAGILPSV